MKNKVIVILSGGLDSSLTAYKMKALNYDLSTVHFSYGQRTEKRELQAFRDISKSLNITNSNMYEIQLPFFKQIGKSSLIDKNLEINTKGIDKNGIPNSYVPFRNGIMLSIATAIVEKENAIGLAIGVVEEDSSGYPDCRENFINSFEKSINFGTEIGERKKIKIYTPLINLKKSDIVKESLKLKVPLEKTWSCYQNSKIACGVCDSCRLRLQGFQGANSQDKIKYY